MSISCKSCGISQYVKNGFVHGKQRYKCKVCGINFIEGDKRQKYTSMDRLKVLKLYLENCGIRMIERLTGIRNSQISTWIEEAADTIKEELRRSQNNIHSVKDISILELDELCTYLNHYHLKLLVIKIEADYKDLAILPGIEHFIPSQKLSISSSFAKSNTMENKLYLF